MLTSKVQMFIANQCVWYKYYNQCVWYKYEMEYMSAVQKDTKREKDMYECEVPKVQRCCFIGSLWFSLVFANVSDKEYKCFRQRIQMFLTKNANVSDKERKCF